VWTDPRREREVAGEFFRSAPDARALWVRDPARIDLRNEDEVPAHVVTRSPQDVYLGGGGFDPARPQRFWQEHADSRGPGGPHPRVVAEMGWVLQGRPGTEAVATYESSLNAFLASLPVAVICQYGSTRFSPDLLLAMLLSHSLVVIGERVFHNPFYAAGEEFTPQLTRLGTDPIAALIPMWRHFLQRQPGVSEIGALLCASIPSFIPAAAITVHLPGTSHGWRLDTAADALEAIEPPTAAATSGRRLFAVWPSGAGTVSGSVHIASHGGWSWMWGAFDGHPDGIALSRPGQFTGEEVMVFTTLAAAIAAVLTGTTPPAFIRVSPT
jgi:hypothetical protein